MTFSNAFHGEKKYFYYNFPEARPIDFLHWDKKSYQLSEKCATLYSANPVMLTEFLQHNDNFLSGEV